MRTIHKKFSTCETRRPACRSRGEEFGFELGVKLTLIALAMALAATVLAPQARGWMDDPQIHAEARR